MSSATSSAQRFMSTEPSRTSGRVRDWLRLTSACCSHSHTGATADKAPKRWLVPILPLGLLLALTTVARGQSLAPGWPAFLASRDGFPPEVVSTVERVWSEPTLQIGRASCRERVQWARGSAALHLNSE